MEYCDKCLVKFDPDHIVRCEELPNRALCFDCYVEFTSLHTRFCFAYIHHRAWKIEIRRKTDEEIEDSD